MKITEIQVSYKGNNEVRLRISNSKELFEVLLDNWNIDTIELQEEFKIVLFNTANEILGIYPFSKGGLSKTVVDLKLIFSVTLLSRASAIAITHNHPSGNVKPSKSDNFITDKIIKASTLFDVKFLDHLIISKNNYYSYADADLIK